MRGHRRMLERTNHGCYFSECSCGWSGGVYPHRTAAIIAHESHVSGGEPVAPIPTVVIFGDRPRGMRT